LGLCLAKKGETSLADYYIRRARSIDASDVQLIYDEAVIRALANQPQLAIESLRYAFKKGNSPEQAKLDPEFKSLSDNPDFIKLVSESLDKSK
jgi:hypothetical protein